MVIKNFPLRLRIVSRSGCVADLGCSSVRLNIADGEDSKGGGSLGIRQMFLKSVMLLAPGYVTAFQNDEKLSETYITSGFATVINDVVTVITDDDALHA